MMTTIAAALLCSIASALQAPVSPATPAAPEPAPSSAPSAPSSTPAKHAPAVHASTAATPSVSAADALGLSTYTVSTLYTGDKVRDPFLPPSVGGGGSARARDKNASLAVDIHALELRGIMKDANVDFAIFSTDTGASLILRGRSLYDAHNKRVPGITGRVRLKQKRAELVTADKDVQIYSLGETDADKTKDAESEDSDETEETGSGRSP
jgi:hypothetical protein